MIIHYLTLPAGFPTRCNMLVARSSCQVVAFLSKHSDAKALIMPISTRSKRTVPASVQEPSTPNLKANVKRLRLTANSPQAAVPEASRDAGRNPISLLEASGACPHSVSIFQTAECIQAGVQHLLAADPVLAPILQEHGYPADKMLPSGAVTCFEALVKSIIYQQLSGKVAATIHGRVIQLCKAPITPAAVLAASREQLRACGLSERKAEYLTLLATRFHTSQWTDSMLHALPDEELIELLTEMKGIGPWTVHMLAIFNLGRTNILPVGDLGVRKGMMELYKLPKLPTPQQMEQIASAWAPYRSIGAYLMWRVPCNASPAKPKAARGRSKSVTTTQSTATPTAAAAAAAATFLP